MTGPNFADILYDAADPVPVTISGQYPLQVAVSLMLATTVPELCTTCGGTGLHYYEWGGMAGTSDPCTDCPTIGRLLAIGAAAWADDYHTRTDTEFRAVVKYRDHLRAVRP